MTVIAEFRSMFAADDREQADALLEALFLATEEIVCPASEERRETCGACEGTGLNPLANDEDPDMANDPAFAAGSPCWSCAGSTPPGTVIQCARDHTESGQIHIDGRWLDREDRSLLRLMDSWLVLAATDGPDAVIRAIAETRASYADGE